MKLEITEVEFDEELYKKNIEENEFNDEENEELSEEDIRQIEEDIKNGIN